MVDPDLDRGPAAGAAGLYIHRQARQCLSDARSALNIEGYQLAERLRIWRLRLQDNVIDAEDRIGAQDAALLAQGFGNVRCLTDLRVDKDEYFQHGFDSFAVLAERHSDEER
jgi:hypothetical protein